MTKISAPAYVRDFSCIGGACEDSCCIGWDVDIDLDTFKEYQMAKDVQLRKMFQRYVYKNPAPTDLNVDYAKVELTQDKHCPFLNAEHLCMIQKYLGEACLSNVCASFPRILNEIDGQLIMSMSPSCPEAMRLMLKDSEAMHMIELEGYTRHPVITYKVNTKSKQYKNSPVKHLNKVQGDIEEILLDRRLSFDQRFLKIGIYIKGLGTAKNGLESENISWETGNLSINKKSLILVNGLIDYFMPFDSMVYMDLCKKVKRLEQIDGESYSAFMNRNPHILENYFMNIMRKGLFPFTESESVFEAYQLYFVRYLIIRTQLAGLSEIEGGLTEKLVERYLQSFSKVFEHHRTFAHEMIKILKKEKLNSVKQLQSLLTGNKTEAL